MTDIISRISSHKISSETSVQSLLAYFSAQNSPADVQLFVQQKVLWELRNRLVTGDDNLRSDIIHQIISSRNTFHCITQYHEMLLKTVLQVASPDLSPTQSNYHLNKLCLEELLQNLINSFTTSLHCPEHCFCSSIKCHLKLFQLFNEYSNLIIKLNHPDIFSHYFTQFVQSNSRCTAFEFLQLAIEIFRHNRANDQLVKYFNELIFKSTLLDALLPFFSIPHCFIGRKDSQKSDDDPENTLDCVLIRSYILLSLQTSNSSKISSKDTLLNQLYLIKQHQDDDLPSWLIAIFITEDSELFEFLHLAVLSAKTSAEIQFLDCLFVAFLSAIYHDASTLLEMLTTDSGTATTALHFLLAYLKLPRDQLLNPPDQSIVKVLKKLKSKISRLHSRGLFPYNPSALLRLLHSI